MRSRAYRKNDQAWVEQKNGAVVRKLIGYADSRDWPTGRTLTRSSGGRRILYFSMKLPAFKYLELAKTLCAQFVPRNRRFNRAKCLKTKTHFWR